MSDEPQGPPDAEDPPDPEARLALLEEALASYASDPDDPPVAADDHLQAAVALVLRPGGDGPGSPELLLIRRAEHPGDPWSGHMALPGGRRDPDDEDLRATAVRETHEETGLVLGGAEEEEAAARAREGTGRVLGALPVVRPQSVELPSLSIHPFVWSVGREARARVASREVAAVHWIDLDDLLDPATRGTTRIPLRGGVRTFPCFRVAGDVVWGLTYRILTDFLEAWPEG